MALAGHGEDSKGEFGDSLKTWHILTGLERLEFRQLINRGFDVNFSSAEDPRLAVLAAALAAEQDAEKERSGTEREKGRVLVDAAEWFRGLAAHTTGTLESEANAESLQAAILGLVQRHFSSLILTPVDQIDDSKPLARFGVDSMIASELRTWVWTALRVDIPFLDILSPEKDPNTLAESSRENLLDS